MRCKNMKRGEGNKLTGNWAFPGGVFLVLLVGASLLLFGVFLNF